MVKILKEVNNKNFPLKFDVYQNHSNPFFDKTKINYSLPKKSKVRFIIANESGRIVYKSVSNEQDAGFYEVEFMPENLAEGIYFFQFITCDNFATRTMDFNK